MIIRLNEMKPLLKLIVKAVEKGVGEDIRSYIAQNDDATTNCVRLMRADKINTNLRDSILPAMSAVELKYFHRSAWTGCLLIDRQNCVTYTICSRQTLDSIPKKKDRKIPHYLQSILYVQNSDVEAEYKQLNFADLDFGFTDDDYRKDYKSIMEDDISFGDEYHHLVIVYEAEHFEVTSIAVKALDKDFRTAQEYSLTEFLKPDFSELTTVAEKEEKKDAHNLVAVKAGLKKTAETAHVQETRVTAKKAEEKKQA